MLPTQLSGEPRESSPVIPVVLPAGPTTDSRFFASPSGLVDDIGGHEEDYAAGGTVGTEVPAPEVVVQTAVDAAIGGDEAIEEGVPVDTEIPVVEVVPEAAVDATIGDAEVVEEGISASVFHFASKHAVQ
ncbi:hypothetical protein V6N13_065499 [Hibiscus sabdariffa]